MKMQMFSFCYQKGCRMFTCIHIKFIDNTLKFGLIRRKIKYNYRGIKLEKTNNTYYKSYNASKD